jgi:hypothetical protein
MSRIRHGTPSVRSSGRALHDAPPWCAWFGLHRRLCDPRRRSPWRRETVAGSSRNQQARPRPLPSAGWSRPRLIQYSTVASLTWRRAATPRIEYRPSSRRPGSGRCERDGPLRGMP